MLKKITLLFVIISLYSCHEAEKATDIYWKEKIYGATVKAVDITNMNFDVNDPESTFQTEFRFIANDLGQTIEEVNIYVGYKDHTILGTEITGTEILFKTLAFEDLYEGPDFYPRYNLEFTFAEVVDALQMQLSQVVCKDQFLLRFEINIDSGLSLSANSVSPCIMGVGSFYESPFEYAINVVDPIEDDDFTGRYLYESVVDGFFGGTLGEDRIVTLSPGHSTNTRQVNGGMFYFTIACDGTIMGRHFYQPGANNCRTIGNASILGPDDAMAPINPNDDSIVDLWLVEGYLGYDGGFDFGTLSTEIRFSKQ